MHNPKEEHVLKIERNAADMLPLERAPESDEVETDIICQRTPDGYDNATAICRASGKSFEDYERLGSTKELLAKLSSAVGKPLSQLVMPGNGGEAELQDTWVHPDVGVNLRQWCSWLTVKESLAALKANAIEAVWASDIEKHFASAPTNPFVGRKWLDKGVARFCQHAALLAIARNFDKGPLPASLGAFLELADSQPNDFAHATEAQVRSSVAEHRQWVVNRKTLICKIKTFRDQQIAHVDKAVVREFCAGKVDSLILEVPTLVEQAAGLLDDIVNIVNTYSLYFDGQAFDLVPWREQIWRECREYAQFRCDSRQDEPANLL